MTGEQVTVVVTAITTALSGLGGAALGGWITQRSATSAKHLDEVDRARTALLRLAALLVAESSERKDTKRITEDAATGSIALGYGSKTALAIIGSMDTFAGFEYGSFPYRKAREDLLSALDKMLEQSLPKTKSLRYKDLAADWEIRSAVTRPD
jgi:hypothetical protein